MATIQLNDDDRRAIDSVLERDSISMMPLDASPSSGKSNSPIDERRARSVGKILNLLNHLPVTDPPASLMMATQRRIDAAIAQKAQVGAELDGTVYGMAPPVI